MQSASPNAGIIEAWNTVLFDKFLRYRQIAVEAARPFGEAAIERLAPAPSDRVLDLGCGFGETTLYLAERAREVVGVDCAKQFVDIAAREAAEADIPGVEFAVKDAQVDDLGGPYDVAFSRFGMMFFTNPVAALRNVGRSLRPGGRLGMTVWRRRDENLWCYAAEVIVRKMIEAPEETDAVTCGPGPFSMAGADTVSGILMSAGYERITLERHDTDICIGQDIDEAVGVNMALGPAGETIRLAGDVAEQRREEIDLALREGLGRYLTDRGVMAPASVWIVTATWPGA